MRTSSSAEIPDSALLPQALVPVYEARRRRTVQLVEAGAQALNTERLPVSLASLAARTRQLDPEGKGVSETTIQPNLEARAIYELHRAAVGTRRVGSASAGAAKLGALTIKPERDLARAQRRYQRLPKIDLVERVLVAEQAFATERQLWLRTADELLVWMQFAAQLARSLVKEGTKVPETLAEWPRPQ
jgi:hypothetical protein